MASDVIERFSKPVNPQTDSPFFKKLPAELRNRIYDLAYAAETEDDGTIDLKATKPPTKDLALTCQRLYAESYGMLKVAYLDYWRHEFVVDALPGSPAKASVCNADDDSLALITKMTIRFRGGTFKPFCVYVALTKTTKSKHSDFFAFWEVGPAPHTDSATNDASMDSSMDIFTGDNLYKVARWVKVALHCEALDKRDRLDYQTLQEFLHRVTMAPGSGSDE